MKKILFLGHEATLSGAPKSLYRLMKWLKQNSDFELVLLLRNGGGLLPDYQKITEVILLENIKPVAPKLSLITRIVSGFLRRVYDRKIICKKRYDKLLELILPKFDYQAELNKILLSRFATIDIIFSNTSTNGFLLRNLAVLNKPIITRVAEMWFTIKTTFLESFMNTKKFTSYFVAVSNAVKQDLMDFDIPENKICVIHGAIDNQEIIVNKINLRNILQIPLDSFLVLASGTFSNRKGADLFVQIALQTVKQNKKIHFVWIGGNHNSEYFIELQQDINKIPISDNLHFISELHNPYDYYSETDIFLMTSREDPFPLVNLENGILKKPIICFDNSGGSSEVVENNCGIAVPFLDISEATRQIIFLYNNTEARKVFGENVYHKIISNYTIEHSGQKFLQLLLNY